MTERSLFWKCGQVLVRIISSVQLDLKVFGTEHIPPRGGALILSNHQSGLDPFILAVKLARPVSYFAKSELFENRLGGWILRKLNGFPVRLGAGDVGALKETIQRLQQGHLLNLYPEGARTQTGEMGHIQRGVALVIRRAKVPIIPAAIVGAFEAWPIWAPIWKCGRVRIRYGPALNLVGMKDDEIVEVIDRTLRKLFDDLRRDYPVKGNWE